MDVFISLKGSDRPFADSFITENLKGQNKFKYWYLFDIQKDKTGEDTKETIINKIENSSGALLLVSNDFLKSEFILNYELPAIFKKKEINDSYKIIPVFVENCDISKNKYLNNLEFFNSPGTNLHTLQNRSAKEYSEKVGEINNFINKNLSRTQFVSSLFKKSKFFISSIALFILLYFFTQTFNENNNTENVTSNEVNAVENLIDSTITESSSFDILSEGDCFNYKDSFIAFALTKDVLDKEADLNSSDFLSLGLENGYIGEDIEIVSCDSPHFFEVFFASNTKVLSDDYSEIESQPEIFEFCVTKNFLYSGYKFRNINSFVGAQYRESPKNYKFICASYEVDDDLRVVQKNNSHKDIQQLSSETLYETSFDKLNIGDCFLHVNSWGIKEYESTFNFGGYFEALEVVDCSSQHTNELIYEVQLNSNEDGIIFPGVKLPLELEELDSYNYPRIVNIPNDRFNYSGGYVYEIYTNNKYTAPINKINDLTDVQYDLQKEEEVFAWVAPYDDTSIHVIKIDSTPNIVSKSRILVFQEAEKLCNALPITGTDLYTDYKTSSTYWKVFPMFSNEPQSASGAINLRCVLSLRNSDPLVIASLPMKGTGNSAKRIEGSFSESFKNKYGDSLLNKREIRIKYNLQNKNIEVKKLIDLKTGDCFNVNGLFNYENYLSDTWNEDWFIKTSSCNSEHNHEVLVKRDDLLTNENKSQLYESCKDYAFEELQFSKKLTLGNFQYSSIDYENDSLYFSNENIYLKDLYNNKFFNKNLVDRTGSKSNSVCIHWYGNKNDDYVSEPPNEKYYSAFETFQPSTLNIENFYCPIEVKAGEYTEVVFRYTRGSAEIVSFEYIEINGNSTLTVNGLDDEYMGYDEGFLKTAMNKTFEGLVPSVVELTENIGEGVMTASITDELGNKDSAICTYKITK